MRQRVFDSGREDAEATRQRLIEVATVVFAECGFAEARMREIATRAEVNVAMIGYHFENKEGLYGAVIADISVKMAQPLKFALEMAQQSLREGLADDSSWDKVVTSLLVSLCQVMLEEGIGEWSRIMLREQMDPSEFFSELHDKVASPFIVTLADVLEHRARKINSNMDRKAFLLKAVMLMGQLLVFTSAKSSVERVLGPMDMISIETTVSQLSID